MNDSIYVGMDTTQAYPMATVRWIVQPWHPVPPIPWWQQCIQWSQSHWMLVCICAAVVLFFLIAYASRDEEITTDGRGATEGQ